MTTLEIIVWTMGIFITIFAIYTLVADIDIDE